MEIFLVLSDISGSERNPSNVVPQAPPSNENYNKSGDRKKEKKDARKSKSKY